VNVPEAFKESRLDVLHAFMRAAPFATLVTNGELGPMAIHLPTLLRTETGRYGTLYAHAARDNHEEPKCDTGVPALFIYHGPNAYISPSWYPSKQLHGRVVPTWNYIVVHARGVLKTHNEPDWLVAHLKELTFSQESGREHPWALSDAPKEYIDSLVRRIVGLEFVISSITGKWKLSQNRSAGDQDGVINGLLREGLPGALAVADSMKK
jgi:transcriptional regulator